jgi:hypothetical protein
MYISIHVVLIMCVYIYIYTHIVGLLLISCLVGLKLVLELKQ